jgi:hypothetical protein
LEPIPPPQAALSGDTLTAATELAAPLSFWQQGWVQNVLPFATSVSVHAAILLIGALFFLGYKTIAQAAPAPHEPVIVPQWTLDTGPLGGVQFDGIQHDPFRAPHQDQVKDVINPQWDQKQSRKMVMESAGGGEGDSSDTVIGLGPGGGFGHGRNGLGHGQGNRLDGGEGESGGAFAPFGTPSGGTMGVKNPVFGRTTVRRVTFVCDASGSMLNKMGTLKHQLSQAVQHLDLTQSFGIVFFQDENYAALDSNLLMATPENKIRAEKFLDDVIPKGETKPIPGIELAFKQKPELIYILTDGDFPDNEAVLKRIRELNRDKKVKVNTIAFVSDTDTDTAFMDLLKQIAKENNGVYKHVAENEL